MTYIMSSTTVIKYEYLIPEKLFEFLTETNLWSILSMD